MLEFDDSARSEAPPEEVWKILYDPVRFTEWWEGMETTSVGDGEFTFQQVGVPELQLPNRLDGRATMVSVHVQIPDEKVERLADSQREAIRASVRHLARLAAEQE